MKGPLSKIVIDKMVNTLKAELSKRNIQIANIRQRPDFEPSFESQWLHDALLKNQFNCIQEKNQHVVLGLQSEQNLHPMQLRKIKKCLTEGFPFNQESASNIPEVHAFLSSCRKQQGLEINISDHSLEHLFNKLPLNFECFTVRNHENEIMAATVIVLINNQIAYNYLPAFDRAYKTYSPLSFLLYHLYGWLKERNIEIFDLGISSIRGEIQKGLYTYKKRMGAVDSNRFIYEIRLK